MSVLRLSACSGLQVASISAHTHARTHTTHARSLACISLPLPLPFPLPCLALPCLGTEQQVHAGKSSTEGSGEPFLLACRFFDRECAGYLEADDLEEITFMVSDGISRE